MFYPDGSTKDFAGNASAFLCCLSKGKDEVRTKFTLTLLDGQGNAQEINKDYVAAHIFSLEAPNMGFPKFAEKSKLKSSSHLLTIRCVLTVIKEPPTECRRNLIVVPPSKLPCNIERTLKDGKGADVTLLVGGREFSAHRFMLAAQSPVFDAQLFGPMMDEETRCIEVIDMDPAIFEMLLHYIYMDSLPPCDEKGCDAASMQHLLVAADRYGLDRLKVMCEEELSKSINVHTVTSTLAVADQHFCEGLKNACEEFLSAPGIGAIVSLRNGFKRMMAKLESRGKEERSRECPRNLVVVPPPELSGRLERTRKDGKGTDVTFLVGGREFSGHTFMLAAQSPIFDAQFFGPMADKDTRCIEVPDMEPAIFEMLLHFIYTDSLPPCNEEGYDAATMQHLLVAAHRYRLDRLKVMCEEKLSKSINVQTVTSTLAVADQHFCEGLKDACVEFLSEPRIAAIVWLRNGFTRCMAKLESGDKEVSAAGTK
ncbi:unnamed protein product [Triticum turgidum subsp. durum]|uniref:BTB domain-containing protein n=1 Tax=Triticum turgidum subsp. durum TaxID=4567 RepID=A0A9R1PYI0_TRITD|nr:unnamed protein product [Triticum turgidum subsp. durum]